MIDLQDVWQIIASVSRLEFEAKSSRGELGWNGSGKGDVVVETAGHTVLFTERGRWTPEGGGELTFKNIFRWMLKPDQQWIGLEHLRFGEDHPVFLFDLHVVGEGELEAVEPHMCVNDRYTGRLILKKKGFEMTWQIQGPAKDEQIWYRYF